MPPKERTARKSTLAQRESTPKQPKPRGRPRKKQKTGEQETRVLAEEIEEEKEEQVINPVAQVAEVVNTSEATDIVPFTGVTAAEEKQEAKEEAKEEAKSQEKQVDPLVDESTTGTPQHSTVTVVVSTQEKAVVPNQEGQGLSQENSELNVSGNNKVALALDEETKEKPEAVDNTVTVKKTPEDTVEEAKKVLDPQDNTTLTVLEDAKIAAVPQGETAVPREETAVPQQNQEPVDDRSPELIEFDNQLQNMDYLQWAAYEEEQNGPPQGAGYNANLVGYTDDDQYTSLATSTVAGKSDYWNGSAPIEEKFEINGEMLSLPKLAPRDEPDVTVRTVILKRTIQKIKNHKGGARINWNWKLNALDTRLQVVCPSVVTLAEQLLPGLKDTTTIDVYEFSDCRLHGNDVRNDLDINDPAAAANILAATRTACRWISMTLTYSPRRATPTGNSIDRNNLPEASTVRVYIRAPQEPGGGLLNAITRDDVERNPDRVIRRAGVAGAPPVYHILKSGTVPLEDNFTDWMELNLDKTYFYASEMIATKNYIGDEVATDTLRQRFLKISQRKWNPKTKKPMFLTANQLYQEINLLVNECRGMSPAEVAENVPELDILFYNALLKKMQVPMLARLTKHGASASLGQNIQRLDAILSKAHDQERNLNEIVTVAAGTKYNRAIAEVGGSPASRSGARAFAASVQEQVDAAAEQGGMGNVSCLPVGTVLTQGEVFALTCISSVEKSIRDAASTNAPVECWGCKGIHSDCQHLFKDCPYKHEIPVQKNFRTNLDAFMKQRNQNRFNPNHYKRDGFVTKRASDLYNDIGNPTVSASSRADLVNAFVAEVCAYTASMSLHSRKTAPGGPSGGTSTGGTGGAGGPVSLPCWMVGANELPFENNGNHLIQLNSFSATRSHSTQEQQGNFKLLYPIASELPHMDILVGLNGECTVEGMCDSGGCSTMGELAYWRRVTQEFPTIVAAFEELATHEEQPITIGGVGAGTVKITHILKLHLPWKLGKDNTELVIGLGDHMPMTLLFGLPFLVAAQCVMDIGNLTCYSRTFDATWKLKLKRPSVKDARSLDAIVSAGRKAFPSMDSAFNLPAPAKKVKFTWDVVEIEEDQE